jgi:hypothetical protein
VTPEEQLAQVLVVGQDLLTPSVSMQELPALHLQSPPLECTKAKPHFQLWVSM